MEQGQVAGIKASFSEVKASVAASAKDKKAKGVKAEAQAHLMQQIESLSSTIDSFDKMVSVGVPLAEASEGLQRLTTLQQDIDSTNSKLNRYVSNLKEVRDKIEELNGVLSSKINKNQLESIVEKSIYLEKLYNELSVSKTNDSLMAILEILENLRKRIKQLETEAEKELKLYVGSEQSHDSHFTTGEGTSQWGGSGSNLDKENTGSDEETTKEGKKKGFFARLFSIFSKKKGE